ncbi:MAG: hypothetical protein AB8F26_10720 [Phycisphaerales bacterium]
MTIILDAHPLRVTIDPALGASITDFSIAGPNTATDHTPILRRTTPGTTDPGQTASFVMAPWTNRIQAAQFHFQGTKHQLRSNFPDATAIHGVARDAPWRITDRTPVSARMVYDSRADENANYPFPFACVQRFELAPDHLSVELSVTNLGDTPMPATLGHHPHFNRHLFSATEEPIIKIDVASRYPCDNCIPTALPENDEHCERLRAGAEAGNHNLDDVFAGFNGRATITYPHSNIRLTLDAADIFTHLVVFTPRASEATDAPPRPWFCIEPCTAVNNAFNMMDQGNPATGTRILDPGQSLESSMRYRVEHL